QRAGCPVVAPTARGPHPRWPRLEFARVCPFASGSLRKDPAPTALVLVALQGMRSPRAVCLSWRLPTATALQPAGVRPHHAPPSPEYDPGRTGDRLPSPAPRARQPASAALRPEERRRRRILLRRNLASAAGALAPGNSPNCTQAPGQRQG